MDSLLRTPNELNIASYSHSDYLGNCFVGYSEILTIQFNGNHLELLVNVMQNVESLGKLSFLSLNFNLNP